MYSLPGAGGIDSHGCGHADRISGSYMPRVVAKTIFAAAMAAGYGALMFFLPDIAPLAIFGGALHVVLIYAIGSD